MKRELLGIAGAAVLGLLCSGAAHAATTSGAVDQYYATATTTFVYVTPSSFVGVPSYVYFCSTTDPELARAIVGGLHKNAYVSCSLAWPTTGTYRYGGTLTLIYVN